jgi:hypothetical protein
MAPEAHARRADTAGAGGQGEKVVDCGVRIGVIGLESLGRVSGLFCQDRRSACSLTLVIFHSFPWSVPGTSYARGSGPVKSW